MHLKLNELLHARNGLVNLEALPDSELEALHQEFEALQKRSKAPHHPGRATKA